MKYWLSASMFIGIALLLAMNLMILIHLYEIIGIFYVAFLAIGNGLLPSFMEYLAELSYPVSEEVLGTIFVMVF